MYLFYRTARMGPGSAHEEMAWATAITEKVNQISETQFTLWTPFLSPGVNTLGWMTMVEDLSVLEATNDKLANDNGYLMLLEQGARYASGDAINDGVAQLIVADMPDKQQPAYVTVVSARLAPGGYVRGIEVGVEIAARAKKATGAPTSFALDMTGDYGGLTWMASFTSLKKLQAANEALNADGDFARYLDEHISDCFQPTATQTVYRRII